MPLNLEFLIEDKIRMYEPHVASQFTRDTITTYNWLYETFVASRDRGPPILGPIFDEDDWDGFETVTTACLNSVQGRGGVPLSYILRSDSLRPLITAASSRAIKILWNAPLQGTNFNADNHRVWACLARQCRETPGWRLIHQY